MSHQNQHAQSSSNVNLHSDSELESAEITCCPSSGRSLSEQGSSMGSGQHGQPVEVLTPPRENASSPNAAAAANAFPSSSSTIWAPDTAIPDAEEKSMLTPISQENFDDQLHDHDYT